MATAKTIYTTEERVFIVKAYYQNGESAAAAQRKFSSRYGIHTTLGVNTIKE